MKILLKNQLVLFIEKAHRKVFGHEIGNEMKVFLANLSWSFLGGGLAALVILILNVTAGRLIGPEEYGKYNLVLVIGNYLLVPIYFGLDIASIRAIAQSKDKKEVSENISGAAVFIFISAIVFLGGTLLLAGTAAHLFSTSTSIIKYTVLLMAALIVRNSFDNYIRGISEFKYQFIGRIIETVIVVSTFLFFFIVEKRLFFSSYIYMLVAGAIVISIFYYQKLRPYLYSFKLLRLITQLSYSKFIVLNSALGTVFITLDKLVINKYLNLAELGLYSAYYTASVTLSTQLTQMFNNVFFPSVSRNLNKAVFEKLERLVMLILFPLVLLSMTAVFVLIKLFGNEYSVQLPYVIAFGILGTLQIVYLVYYSVITAFKENVYKRYLLQYYIVNFVTMVAYVLMVMTKTISIINITLALILNYLVIILLQRRLIKKSI